MNPRPASGGRKAPVGAIAIFMVLGLVLVAGGIAGLAGPPSDRVLAACIPVGLFFFWLAWKAHARARQAEDEPEDIVVDLSDPKSVAALEATLAKMDGAQRAPVALDVKPLYSLLVEPQPVARLGRWFSNNNPFDEIIGFTSLGNVFLRRRSDNLHAVLWPLRAGKNVSSLAPYTSVRDFELANLAGGEITDTILQPERVEAIRKRFGALSKGQVYIPVTILEALAGKEPQGYEKSDFWVFIDLCGQEIGMLQE